MKYSLCRAFRQLISPFARTLLLIVLTLAMLPSVQAQTRAELANISTRLRVETGDNVLIAGFIITGTAPKKVIVRAIGPSLPAEITGKIANPTLELVGPGGTIATNDDWRSTQQNEIIASTVPPTNNLESAIVVTLPANGSSYTAVMRGLGDTTGVGLVEVYDLDPASNSKLANISTRGFVQTGDDVMIGGIILSGPAPRRVIIRAIGPSLPLTGKLADPTLEVRDQMGTLEGMNDNWRTSQEGAIIATTVQPTNDLESAVVLTLSAAPHTAIVRGKNETTGVGLVEAYTLAGSVASSSFMFVVNGGDGTPATASVTRAELDGSNATSTGNIGGFLDLPQGIAVDRTAGKLYVTNEGGNTVTMSDLDGSNAVNLTLGGFLAGPYGIAVDSGAGKIYVANGGAGAMSPPRIVVANLDGSSPVNLGNIGGLLGTPQGVAVDVAGGKMYIADQNGTVVKANLDGSGPVALTFGGLLTGAIPLDVALDAGGNKIYVADFNGNVFSADLDGNGGANLGNLGGTLMGPRGITVDVPTQKMYVTNSANNTVTRADLPNGANPVALTVSTLNAPAVLTIVRQ